MGNLDEVVDFRAFANGGGAERAAVNSDAGADFDVVADDDAADLRNSFWWMPASNT